MITDEIETHVWSSYRLIYQEYQYGMICMLSDHDGQLMLAAYVQEWLMAIYNET